eukprot:6190994-Prymnesium_polylepis.1
MFSSLKGAGFIEGDFEDGKLTTGMSPFNVFAKIGAGLLPQKPQPGWQGPEEENAKLGEYADRFVVACNRAENDANWDSGDQAWVGRASMGKRHKFLVPKDLSWWNYNVAVMGLRHREGEYEHAELDGSAALERKNAIEFIESMIAAAQQYCSNSPEWSSHIGVFFNCYPNASVNALHMHIVDLSEVGPTFEHLRWKNLPANDVLAGLRNQLGLPKFEGDPSISNACATVDP